MIEKIRDPEKMTFEEDDSFELPPPDIVAYNEARSCADLYRMYKDKILEIRPKFQREVVWKNAAQTRFIDSLIRQLPIPSMCFSLDYKTQKWQVIDGLQRMWSIIQFLSNKSWELAKLDDINPKISGKKVAEFRNKKNAVLYPLYSSVKNLSLPITVIRCDSSKMSHTEFLFKIFHRLNSGAERLNNQEIRNCIYGGSFNNLLKELEKEHSWMVINKMKKEKGYRYAKQEVILRFFAFHDIWNEYDGRLGKFLNNYMQIHRNPPEIFLREKKDLFNRTVKIVYGTIFDGKMPSKLSISILEGVLVGISLNLDFIDRQTPVQIKAMYEKLRHKRIFSEKMLREGLASKEKVKNRMLTAKKVFSGK